MRGSAARALWPALAVLTLVAVVAIASTGSTPGGSADTRRPSHLVLDTIVSLVLVLFVVVIGLLVWAFIRRDEMMMTVALGKHRRSALGPLIVFGVVLALVVFLRWRDWLPSYGNQAQRQRQRPGAGDGAGGAADPYEPEFAWVPMLIILTLAAVAIGAAVMSARRRYVRPPRPSLAATLADALDDSLDDLRAETDPRRAVIKAYARLERVLEAHGLAKRAPETPEEYFTRILPDLEVDARSIRNLTDLFTWAKFSQHEVGLGMKEEAIEALTTVRDDLRAAEYARAEAARTSGPVPALEEPA